MADSRTQRSDHFLALLVESADWSRWDEYSPPSEYEPRIHLLPISDIAKKFMRLYCDKDNPVGQKLRRGLQDLPNISDLQPGYGWSHGMRSKMTSYDQVKDIALFLSGRTAWFVSQALLIMSDDNLLER